MSPTLTLRHYIEAPLAHSHDHAQLVFGLFGHLDLEVDGRGSQVRESSVMVLPFCAHHACGSRDGSRCLVLDVPSEHWVLQSLGEHADASRRLLDQPARLALDLLRKTPLPIGEIADRVGYTSQSAFAAAMLREFGASPGALRRNA